MRIQASPEKKMLIYYKYTYYIGECAGSYEDCNEASSFRDGDSLRPNFRSRGTRWIRIATSGDSLWVV